MDRLNLTEKLKELPPLLAADRRVVWATPVSADEIAVCTAHRDARLAAINTHTAWVQEKGGEAFFMDDLTSDQPMRASHFLFRTAPHQPDDWLEATLGFQVRGLTIYEPRAAALIAERDALPVIPHDSAIFQRFGFLAMLRFATHLGWQTLPAGRGGTGAVFRPEFGWGHDEFFVSYANPWYDVATLVNNPDLAQLEVHDEDLAWTLPEGWALCGQPGVD